MKNKEKINQIIDFIRTSNLETNRQTLWHGIKLKNFINQLNDNQLLPYTSHRYWKDGIRRKENDPLYEDSLWMYGWSMTRKREYATSWSDVILELDSEKISQNFEIMPISWNNLFTHNTKMKKKEFEEFVIAFKDIHSLSKLKEEDNLRTEKLDTLYDTKYSLKEDSLEYKLISEEIKKLESIPNWKTYWDTPKGKPLNLERCLKGIYIKKEIYDIYNNDSENNKKYLNTLTSHKLFKGFLELSSKLKI